MSNFRSSTESELETAQNSRNLYKDFSKEFRRSKKNRRQKIIPIGRELDDSSIMSIINTINKEIDEELQREEDEENRFMKIDDESIHTLYSKETQTITQDRVSSAVPPVNRYINFDDYLCLIPKPRKFFPFSVSNERMREESFPISVNYSEFDLNFSVIIEECDPYFPEKLLSDGILPNALSAYTYLASSEAGHSIHPFVEENRLYLFMPETIYFQDIDMKTITYTGKPGKYPVFVKACLIPQNKFWTNRTLKAFKKFLNVQKNFSKRISLHHQIEQSSVIWNSMSQKQRRAHYDTLSY